MLTNTKEQICKCAVNEGAQGTWLTRDGGAWGWTENSTNIYRTKHSERAVVGCISTHDIVRGCYLLFFILLCVQNNSPNTWGSHVFLVGENE